MWRLIQDFFRQNWIMRGVIALGWLSILIMVTSAYVTTGGMWKQACEAAQDSSEEEWITPFCPDPED